MDHLCQLVELKVFLYRIRYLLSPYVIIILILLHLGTGESMKNGTINSYASNVTAKYYEYDEDGHKVDVYD